MGHQKANREREAIPLDFSRVHVDKPEQVTVFQALKRMLHKAGTPVTLPS
jgi:hypothetical protein